MKLRIQDHEVRLINLRTRMPFKYGIATMVCVPQLFVRLQVEVAGRKALGMSADLLPAEPLGRIIVRHTIGLSDPLADSDIAEADRLKDGLPQSLTECITTYGLRHFKIKVNGELERDRDRLERIASLIEQYAPTDYAFSLDGNEQFKSIAALRTFWESVEKSAKLHSFLQRLLFVEQPLHRDVALHPG